MAEQQTSNEATDIENREPSRVGLTGLLGGLLGCPFCGSVSIDEKGWLDGDGIYGPQCRDCGATSQSVERWNMRAVRP